MGIIPRGRPKTYAVKQIGVKLPGLVDIRIRSEALKSGRTISELVRDTLVEKWGNGKDATTELRPAYFDLAGASAYLGRRACLCGRSGAS